MLPPCAARRAPTLDRVTRSPAGPAAGLLLTIAILALWPAAPAPAAERVEGTVGWDLAASERRLTTDTRRVRIVVSYGACSGEPGTPNVRRTGRSVIVTVPMQPAEPLPPDVVCPAIGYAKTFTVRLRGRLGARALRDGSRRPARFVARAKR